MKFKIGDKVRLKYTYPGATGKVVAVFQSPDMQCQIAGWDMNHAWRAVESWSLLCEAKPETINSDPVYVVFFDKPTYNGPKEHYENLGKNFGSHEAFKMFMAREQRLSINTTEKDLERIGNTFKPKVDIDEMLNALESEAKAWNEELQSNDETE